MGMYDNLKDINSLLRNDETLLRLLYYPPKNYQTSTPDALDPSLPNILEMDAITLRELREKRIKLVPKDDDLQTEPICRIYIYAGRRTPTNNNFLFANQELIIDVLCHEEFEKDLRSYRISDRLNELLCLERVTGIGQIGYVQGGQISSPTQYVGFRHVYESVNFKK